MKKILLISLLPLFLIGCSQLPTGTASVDYTYHVAYSGTGPVSIQYLPDYPSTPSLVEPSSASPVTWSHSITTTDINRVWIQVNSVGLTASAGVTVWITDSKGGTTKSTSGLSFDSGLKSYLLIVDGHDF